MEYNFQKSLMKNNYETRVLEVDDYKRGFLDLLGQLTTIGNISEINFMRRVEDISNDPNHIILVKVDKNRDKIIASGTIFIEKKFIHELGYVGHIEDIVVDNKYRRKGFGKEIVESLVEFSKNIGCYKVILDCSESNEKFYENCGFKKKGSEMSRYF